MKKEYLERIYAGWLAKITCRKDFGGNDRCVMARRAE